MAKNKVSILVAKVTLSLGRDEKTGERNTLPGGEELTDELVKKFTLAKKDIQSLIDEGKLVPIEVRAAATGVGSDNAALAAANAEIADLKAKLAEASQGLEDADADYADLEKHVTVLEVQIKALGAEPTARAAAEGGEEGAEAPKATKAAATKA